MHHIYGPSSLWRRRGCPASARLERDLPETQTEASQMGTSGHELISKAILVWKCGLLPTFVDDELGALAEKCYMRFLKLVEDIEALKEGPVTPSNVWAEILLPLDVPDYGLIYGTCDVLVVHSTGVYILDWKFGYMHFDHDSAAWQVMGYGEAALRQAPVGIHPVAHCYLYNPRLEADADCVFGPEDGALEMIAETIRDSEKDDAQLQAGDWCRYCKALGICEKTVEEATDLVKDIARLPDGLKRHEETSLIKQEVMKFPAERLTPLLDVLPRVETACEAVRSRAKACLKQEPGCLVGWKLLEKNGRRAADMTKLFDAVSGVLEEDEFWGCCSVNVAAAEKVFAEKFPTTAEGKREFKACTSGVVYQGKITEMRRVKNPDA